MTRNLLTWDNETSRVKRSSLEETDVGGFLEVTYAVTGEEGATEFPAPSGATITASCYIAFLRNGVDLVEGPTEDFLRNVSGNKAVSNYTIPKGSKVKLRVYQG